MKNDYRYIPLYFLLDWEAFVTSSHRIDQKGKNIYALLDFCYKTSKDCNSFQRSDIIGNLRRILTRRINEIFKIYSLDNIEFNIKKKGKLEMLEKLGIVKPLLIHELLTIRNGIEYSDKKPPNQEKVRKLIDMMWYFLKSTDNYTYSQVESIHFDHRTNNRHYLEATYSMKKKWKINLRGWIPRSKLHTNPKDNCIKIILTKGVLKKQDSPCNFDKLDSDICIDANLILEPKNEILLLSYYFKIPRV